MQIIYLDQNKWIELARAAYNTENAAPKLRDVLLVARYAVDHNLARFPLSLAHYIETLKQHAPQRRKRLARFMMELSGRVTVASPITIVKHEIDVALYRFFPNRVHIRPLNLLGEGLAYAGDYPRDSLMPAIPAIDGLPSEMRSALRSIIIQMMENTYLSGVNPFSGESTPKADLSGPEDKFKEHLDALPASSASLDLAMRKRVGYAGTLVDIFEPILEALNLHGISLKEFAALGEQNWRIVLESMPSRNVEMHLHQQWAKNPMLKAKRTDLNDWAYLGIAVAYCDIVVTEKLFADLIQREGYETHAKVLTKLDDLLPEMVKKGG